MKKFYILSFLIFSSLCIGQSFGSYASGIKIENTIYNTSGTGVNQINPNPGAQNFNTTNLGNYGQNSTCSKITGGEIKTFKTATGNVCSATLFWRVYLASATPSGTFNIIPLANTITCNTGTSVFNDELGPCAANDQKWKDYTLNSNFAAGLTPNNYILEIYFSNTGSDVSTSTCETTKLINNSGNNFKANFSITNPICNPTASPTTLCEGSILTLTSNPTNGVAPYSYNWTGPNGYTSVAANPTITTTLNSAGVYSLIVTDACGAISTQQSTTSVIINPKINPEFDGINPGLCKNGTPPLLPNQSTNGINGTWNPTTVDNTTVGTFQYTFTPNSGQCANVFVQTIFVVNNVNPTFTFPTTICQNSTAPLLPSTSANGVQGIWNPSTIANSPSGNTSYTFTPNSGQCALVKTITVTVLPNVTPTFTLPSFICQNASAPVLPTTSNNGISGTWSPTTIINTPTGNYSYTFTPSNTNQCGLPFTINIPVNPNITPTFNAVAPICQNATAPVLPSSSTNSPAITGTWSPATVSNTASGTYTFTPNAGQCATQATLNITVNPNVTPTFNPIPNVCYQTTPPSLPTTSLEGLTGTWNPATISNTASGTYTFTPTAGLCALPTTITVTVTIITPTFDALPPVCLNGAVPSLPTTSNNGITGVWNPATISNTANGTYTFTPNPNQCATTVTISVTVNPNITPTFTAIAPICSGATAPVLATTSNNGITGTWNPTTVNNTTTGTYTFTPNPNQCALTATITVTVNPNITPSFNALPIVCQNGTVPTLATTSNNGIAGTWNPATISNTTSGSYIFTPNTGQCANPLTINVTVNPNITPTFNALPPVCLNGSVPTLPTSSTNSPPIMGTWNPATISNTTSGTYTFTPNAGQCATTVTISVTVNPNVTPTFDPIPAVCYNSTPIPTLATTSNNGITGTWNPTTISNTTSGTYTFTPNPNQCAATTILSVTVNIVSAVFDSVAPICYGSTPTSLPTTSNNGITGTWNPATLNTSTAATYTFTPNPNQCAPIISFTSTINQITPTFDAIPAVCYNSSTIPTLQTTSNNGITGTWNPATVSNTTSGTYTFSPNANQCALPVTISVTVTTITPSFSVIAPFCENTTAPNLQTTSNNGVTGSWNPATVSNTDSGNYTFIPNPDQCATDVTITITVTPSTTPTFNTISDVCYGTTAPALPSTSINGISGTWNPTIINNTASGTYTFTPTPSTTTCPVSTTLNVVVTTIIAEFDTIPTICYGSTVPNLPTTSNNGITGVWNPTTISNTASGTYTFTPDANQCAPNIIINTIVTTVNPIFTIPNSVCENATTPLLPSTSDNAITGTWNPAIIANTSSGVYTFTPDTNQCATNFVLNFTVNPVVTPTFDTIADVCYNSSNVPTLPTTSNNGISGTWNPATVNNLASGTYNFTPNPGECANATSITINVTTINPLFTLPSSICENAIAPILPTTSNNGIIGTWNPTTVTNTTSATYSFSPNPNQCAANYSITISATPNVTPTFTQIPDVCYNTSNIQTLPTTSNNGISGTWNPVTVSNTTAGTYTFTPNTGECAFFTTMTIGINSVDPTFTQIADVCHGTAFTPALPAISNNGITGTWNPATISNTTSGVYTFTPDAEQCATIQTLNVNVNTITPTFNTIPNVCYGTANATILPLTSLEGITGTWNPTLVSNTVANTYTFTPNPEQCAITTQLNIGITVINPAFNFPTAICQDGTAPVLPTSSVEGIQGNWSPSTVSNTATGTYTFTPNTEQCATTTNVTITVGNNILPTFNLATSYCQNDTVPILPAVSSNGITGTWNPTIINNIVNGNYIFTPNAGQCALSTNVNVTITPTVTPTFNAIAPICSISLSPTLPLNSLNGYTGTWNPATISNTSSGIYTFTPTAGQCATTATLSVTVFNSPTDLEFNITNVFNQTSNGIIEITSVVNGVDPYLYSINGSSFTSTTSYNSLSPGDYEIIVRDSNGCEFIETVTIESGCMFPKGISPNGDGKNDTFNLADCSAASLEIFNRYGTKVNSFSNYNNQWDGTSSSGQELPDATYYYVARLSDGTIKTGWVYISRQN